jgi:peptidoglycan hydrolase-like protein with peptidoglycan-binding domain
MPGLQRDLAALDPWNASLERSRARRARTRGRRRGTGAPTLSALLDARARAHEVRDLAAQEPWELSLGRSRARRRAAELQFVPASSRAKRISLGALAALTVGPTSSLADGHASGGSATPTPEPPTTAEHSIMLSYESEGRQVELLQQALGGITVDGVFGPQTEEAVREFQAGHGLTVDGIVGPSTAAALRRTAQTSGSTGYARRTTAAFVTSETASSEAADGEFGPETEAAIARLQARHGLTVDGIAGPATWAVVGVHGEQTLTPPPEAVPQSEAAGEATSGATSEAAPGQAAISPHALKRLQAALHLSRDGEFGPETEAAIMRLQARHGLAVDGVVGPATWNVIGVSNEGTLQPPPSAVPHVEASAPAEAAAEPSAGPGGSEPAAPELTSSRSSGSSGSSSSGSSVGSSSSGPSTSSGVSGGGSGAVSRVIAAGNEIATRPYVYGGGHGSFKSNGYDCSGSVSYALHGAGLINSPEDSSQLESYGASGPGKHITIYANSQHTFMVVNGKRFDTVAQAQTGTRWSSSTTSTSGYVVRHPVGY